MLESIFSGMVGGLSGMLDSLVQWLLVMPNFDMERPLVYMPAIAKFYDILQWVALGLIGAIAVFQLGKFFFGSLSESKDSPVRILVRSAVAAGLVYVGNYGLQMIFDLFSYPMNALLDVSVTVPGSLFVELGKVVFSPGLAGILINLILICALGWNVLKLLLEAVERWLMLCVLIYISPLAYATIASQATHEIFRKFFSMVMGQSILLLANVWSVKLLINILTGIDMTLDPGKKLFGFIVAFAFARIAQKMDSYLQQLGVNAATTGGSLLDTLAAVGSVGSGLFGGGGQKGGLARTAMGAAGNVLGEAVKSGNVVKGAMFGGGFGAAAAAVGKAIRKGANGASMTAGDYVKSKVKSAASGAYDNATEAMGNTHPNGADAMRRAKETASSMRHGGNDARETAKNAGFAAAEKAVREGKTPEEAKEAGLNAYDKALKENAPLGEKTSGMFANTSTNMDARQQFAKDLAPAIDKMQNGASRMYVDSNGVVHNGFGTPQPNVVGHTPPKNGVVDPSSAAQTNADPTKGAMGAENPLDPNATALRDAMKGKQAETMTLPVQDQSKPQNETGASIDPNAAAMQEAANNGTLMDADGSSLVKDVSDPNSANASADIEQGSAGNAEPDPNAAALHEKAEEAAGQNPDDGLAPVMPNPYEKANADKNDAETSAANIDGVTAKPGNVAKQTTDGSTGTANTNGTAGNSSQPSVGSAGARVLNAVGQQVSGASAKPDNAAPTSSVNANGLSGTSAADGNATTRPGNVAKQTMDNSAGTNDNSQPAVDSAGARVLHEAGAQPPVSPNKNTNTAPTPSGAPVDDSGASAAKISGAIPNGMSGGNAANVASDPSPASDPDSAGERVKAAAGQSAQKAAPAPTIQGPNAMAARTIAGSANSRAAEAGTGFAEYVKNPDPNAYTASGEAAPGHSAQVLSNGTELALNTIAERGSEVADSIIQSDAVVDNQAVAAATFQNSSFMSGMDTDVAQSFAAMDRTGIIPAARDAVPDQGIEAIPNRGSVTDMKVGKGVSEFTYEAPAATDPSANGQTNATPVPERITVRTSTAFNSLPAQEQSLYRAAQTSTGDTFYMKRVPVSDHTPTSQEHQSKDNAKRFSGSSGHGANGGSGHSGSAGSKKYGGSSGGSGHSTNGGSGHSGSAGSKKYGGSKGSGFRKPKNQNGK